MGDGKRHFPINFRAFSVVALFVATAVFCVYIYMLDRVVGIVLGCILLAGISLLFILLLLRFLRNKAKLRVVLALGISTVLSVCAFTVGAVSFDKWNEGAEFAGYNSVAGRVCAVDTRKGEYRIELEDLTIGGKRASGNMLVTLSASDNDIAELLDFGDVLIFSTNIKHEKILSGGYVDGYGYRTDIRYLATVDPAEIRIDFGKPEPLEAFLSAVHNHMVKYMGDRVGNIAYSMLTGDKHSLYSGISDMYSAAGFGHILAVSGLHIGFIVMLLGFLLKKLDKKIKAPIIFAVIAAYVVIADFSPSVVRAAIMAVIAGTALIFGGRRDVFSSLMCAFSVILAVKPLYLFDVGFLLSFGAIFGIAMYANMIKQALVRRGINGKISNAVGAPFSVAVGIIPSTVYYFGQFSLIGIIANMVLLPIVSVIFVVTLCLLPISALPYCGPVLVLSKYMFTAFDYITYGLSQIPFVMSPKNFSAAVFLCYPIMFGASDFYMMKRGKAAAVLYSVAACAVIIAVCAL